MSGNTLNTFTGSGTLLRDWFCSVSQTMKYLRLLRVSPRAIPASNITRRQTRSFSITAPIATDAGKSTVAALLNLGAVITAFTAPDSKTPMPTPVWLACATSSQTLSLSILSAANRWFSGSSLMSEPGCKSISSTTNKTQTDWSWLSWALSIQAM